MMLKDVIVYSRDEKSFNPKRMVEKGLMKLQSSCPAHTAIATLKNYITKDGAYKSYRDAKLSITDSKGYGKSIKKFSTNDDIKILNLRESLNLSENQLKFDNSTFAPLDFTNFNGLKYEFRSKKYVYEVIDTLHRNNEELILIQAKQLRDKVIKSDGLTYRYDMKFYIYRNPRDTKDFSIRKFELNEHLIVDKTECLYKENSSLSVTTKPQGDYAAPSLLESISIQEILGKDSLVTSTKLVAFSQLKYDTVNFHKPVFQETLKEKHDYDQKYWESIPIEKQIREDLSQIIDLEKQFDLPKYGNERKEVMDSIHFLRWQEQVGPLLKERPIYLIVYNNPSIFSSHKGLVYEPVRDWLMKFGKSSVVFLGAHEDYYTWSTSGSYLRYAFFDHIYLPSSWEKIVEESECSDGFPKYILLLPSGEHMCSNEPFSTSILTSIDQ
jgi:hypothetical protein